MIMDQRCVVGVGNIYACEALFLAKIHPLQKAKDLSPMQSENLVEAIQHVLQQAIASGGSTIRDFKKAGGESGYFQHHFLVYGKESEPCSICKAAKIENIKISGRSSFFCPNCQKKSNKVDQCRL